MATRRTFADLSSYRNALDRPQISPLDAALQGLQQGVQLQQLPQTLRNEQLARELQNAINQQKLMDLQNPQAALARELQKAATVSAINESIRNPNSGIIQTPTGLVGETIATPGAITVDQQASLPSAETMEMRRLASELGGVNIPNEILPTAPVGLPITPIGAGGIQTGLSIDQNVPARADEAKLDRDIRRDESRIKNSSGAGLRYILNADGGYDVVPTRMIGGEIPTAQPLKRPGGEVVTAPVKGVKNLLVVNEKTGRVSNLALSPGEEIPEGFKKQSEKTSDDFKSVDAFRKEIADNDVVKQFTDVQKSKQRIDLAMQEATTTNNFTAVDQTLISSFNRLLEPDSVTMVSEYARTSADAPLINRIKANIVRITKGGRLSDEERAALSKLSNSIYQASLGNFSKTMDFYEGIGNRRQWTPEDYLPPLASFGSGSNNSSASTEPVRVNTKAERDALKPGTVYISPSGAISTR